MHYTPIDGPSIALRAPRVTPWSHVYWNYATKGDFAAIKNMFAQRKASPFDCNERGNSALHYAAYHKNYRVCQFLLEQGADATLPNSKGRVASENLLECAFAGQLGEEGPSIIGSMFKDNDYEETRAFTKLQKIILGILPGTLSAELEASTTDINTGDSKGRTPLAWAAIRDDIQSVETLLAFRADPNLADASGDAPLAFVRSSSVCKALLKAGAKIQSRNKDYGRTALHQLCVAHGDVETLNVLIEAGLDVDVRDTDNETPLSNAIFWHLPAVAIKLLELGANPNAANISSRDNSIHFAVTYGNSHIIPLLLSRGVEYKAVNNRSRNIAHMAAISADTRTIDTLTRSNLTGLDFSLKDEEGKTPAEYIKIREVFGESEGGIFEAFEAFSQSVREQPEELHSTKHYEDVTATVCDVEKAERILHDRG